MNYKIFLDTPSQQFVGKFQVLQTLRPVIGDIITIGNNDTRYTVTRIEGDTTQNVTLDYFVRITGTSPDSVTMDQSRNRFNKSIMSL